MMTHSEKYEKEIESLSNELREIEIKAGIQEKDRYLTGGTYFNNTRGAYFNVPDISLRKELISKLCRYYR